MDSNLVRGAELRKRRSRFPAKPASAAGAQREEGGASRPANPQLSASRNDALPELLQLRERFLFLQLTAVP